MIELLGSAEMGTNDREIDHCSLLYKIVFGLREGEIFITEIMYVRRSGISIYFVRSYVYDINFITCHIYYLVRFKSILDKISPSIWFAILYVLHLLLM